MSSLKEGAVIGVYIYIILVLVQLCPHVQMMGKEKRGSHIPLERAFDLVGLLHTSVIKPQFR